MLKFNEKVSYLLDSIKGYSQPVSCPFCQSNKATVIDRKYIFARLFECSNCHLYFRHPVDEAEKSNEFYQSDYMELDKLTTDLPTEEELEKLKNSAFNVAANKNADRLLEIFRACFDSIRGIKLVDYGSSWGYISYQFIQAGINTRSFEISVPRASYGNRLLGLDIKTKEADIEGGNDVFFSSHVIEHVPSIRAMINSSKRLLKPEGLFIAICPNGSKEFRTTHERSFHSAWGKVHPSYLNADFYQYAFKDVPYYIGSTPFNTKEIRSWDKQSQILSDVSGEELLVIAKVNDKSGANNG